MSEDMNDAKAGKPATEAVREDARENTRDTISKLLDDRDQHRDPDPNNRDHPKRPGAPQKTPERTQAERLTPEELREEKSDPSYIRNTPKDRDGGKEDDPSPASTAASSARANLSEFEALKVKLEKTEKVLAENQRYGRTNAQKVKNAQKVVQKFADDGLLTEEEAKELFGVLQADGRELPAGGDEREEDALSRGSALSPQASLFAPIFKVANKELENIRKYTDDNQLQDKVNAFDYFLSVGSKEEVGQVLAELTELLDDPVKLAKKMLSMGQTVFEESYKHIQEAGGFKNYLAKKDQELEKRQKKIDKLEKKLLQYEDFDQPSYRIEEMGDGDEATPATDTISTLFGERDKVKQGRKA
jgi:hypothetical protein